MVVSTELDPEIHDPARVRLLFVLAASGLVSPARLAKDSGLTSTEISRHVDRLTRAGLVTELRRGVLHRSFIVLTREGTEALRRYLHRLEAVVQGTSSG